MDKFVLDCDIVLSIAENLTSLATRMEEMCSEISAYDFGDCEDFDFPGAVKAIAANVLLTAQKMKSSAQILNQVVEAHTSLQNSLKFASLQASQGEYVIQAGDTLHEIAEKHNTTVDAIKEANNIENANLISTGTVLVMPGAVGVGGSTQSDSIQSDRSTNTNANNESSQSNSASSDTTTNLESANRSSNTDVSGYKSTDNFPLTKDNKKYNLSDEDKELLMAIVAAEACRESKDDCLAVISVILNRCEDTKWSNSHGTDPVRQATAPGQFVVYSSGAYKKYLNGNVPENVANAVNDALNGVRNNDYLSFRSNGSTSYSSNLIYERGNRYK